MSTPVNTVSKSALVLGIGLSMLPGCPLVEIEADVPEVCLSYPNLQIETPMGLGSIKQSFVFDDLSAAHDLTDLDANLEFVRAEVRATSGIESFSFVRAVHVVVSSGDPDTALPPLTMYNCDGDCAPQDNKLVVPAAAGANAIEYLKSNSIVIDLEFQGDVPAGSWTMDVDVCMKARASYTISL
jgi:hypothetical protein